jgi:hydroxypyruvate isomerase
VGGYQRAGGSSTRSAHPDDDLSWTGRQTSNSVRWVANLSVLFTELDLLDRAAAAADEGFAEVESWWPFAGDATPSQAKVAAFASSIERAGVHLTAMNLFGGAPGERGVLSHPDRKNAFRDSVSIAMQIANRLGTRLFNAPYGNRILGIESEVQGDVASSNLAFAAESAAAIGGTILVEPLSDEPGAASDYPLRTAGDAIRVIDRLRQAGVNNVGLLLDQYHLMVNEDDVLSAIHEYGDYVCHVQVADVPGRGVPGSGSADIASVVSLLRARGYPGAFALEFIASASTHESLVAWRRELATWTDLAQPVNDPG